MKRICKLNVFSCESFDYMESWYKDLAEKGLVIFILLSLVGLLMATIRITVGFRFVKLMKNYKDVDHNIPYKNKF